MEVDPVTFTWHAVPDELPKELEGKTVSAHLSVSGNEHMMKFDEPITCLTFHGSAPYATVFHGKDNAEVLRLDECGMTYRGELMPDAGAAYRAFAAWMGEVGMKIDPRPDPIPFAIMADWMEERGAPPDWTEKLRKMSGV